MNQESLCIKPVTQTCENNVFIKHGSRFGCIASFIHFMVSHSDFEDFPCPLNPLKVLSEEGWAGTGTCKALRKIELRRKGAWA